MNSDKILTSLHNILGSDEIIQTDNKPHIPQSIAILYPSSIEQIQGIVQIAEENSIGIIPSGNGTSLNPRFIDHNTSWLFMSTSKMQKILYYEPDEMVLSAEAGATLEQIQQTLLPNQQWLALDTPFQEKASLGGIVSTNRTLFLRASYGSPRDLLIGMHAVTHKGTLIKGGGRVVKNVAGYDICKLFTNACGTLGILTDTTFRVQVKPELRRVLCWDAPSLSLASETGLKLYQSLLEGNGFIVTNQLGQNPKLLVVLHGTESRVEWQTATFSSLVPFGAPTELEENSLQSLRDRMGYQSSSYSCRLSLLPSELSHFLSLTQGYPELQITVDCSLGIIWMSTDSTDITIFHKLFASLSSDTNIEILSVPDDFSLENFLLSPQSRTGNGIHARIKQQLDPLNTFVSWNTLV